MQSALSAVHRRALDEADVFFDRLSRQSLVPMQAVQVTMYRIGVLAMRERIAEAVRLGLEALRPLGLRWSLRPSRLRIRLEYLRTDWLLRGCDASDFATTT